VFAVSSFVLAIKDQWFPLKRFPLKGLSHEQCGKWLIAFWTFFPPLFFWLDWMLFASHLGAAEQNVAKQSYDLSRNIWIAFVAILTFLFLKK
jgi:hypothetical protein